MHLTARCMVVMVDVITWYAPEIVIVHRRLTFDSLSFFFFGIWSLASRLPSRHALLHSVGGDGGVER